MDLIKKNATQAYESKSEKYSFAAVAVFEQGKGISSINSGVVRADDKAVASFSRFGSDNLNINFSVNTPAEQVSILSEINAFVGAVEADVNKVVTL